MAVIDQSQLKGQVRDRPISDELAEVLTKAADAAGVDVVLVTSGGQPGSTGGRIGSTRHDGGRAADLRLIVEGVTQAFSDEDGGEIVERFVTAAAAHGATGIGAGEKYMGPRTLHVGFGRSVDDHDRLVWGEGGAAANAPAWLREAAALGWRNPPPDWVFQVVRRTPFRIVKPTVPPQAAALDERFNADVVLAAQATQRSLGIPASVTLAQWAVESAYGSRMPHGSNNPFGIKARPGDDSVVVWTKEEVNGKMVSVQAAFRVFRSLDEAFVKHAELLAFGRPYAAARKFVDDPDRFADALTGVYATDSSYGKMLKSIMRKNDLYRFDAASPRSAGSAIRGEADATPLSLEPIGVRGLQEKLVDLGYPLGKIDGKFGTLTAQALLAFQHDNGLPTTGVVDATTIAALQTAGSRRLDDARVKATEQDLAKDGSRIVVEARRSRILSWVTGALGALGIGNSAVINAAGTPATRAAATVPDGLLPFLADVQKMTSATDATEVARLSTLARSLAEQLGTGTIRPDLVQLIAQARRMLPPDLLTRYPDLPRILDALTVQPATRIQPMNTIFDVLPGIFANDGVMQAAMKGVAAVAGSVLPGFGGSLAILGAGIVGRVLANRIAAARVEDHQNADNIRPMKP